MFVGKEGGGGVIGSFSRGGGWSPCGTRNVVYQEKPWSDNRMERVTGPELTSSLKVNLR